MLEINTRSALFISTAISLSVLFAASGARAAQCEDLANLKLPDTTIDKVESIPAGDYTTSDKTTHKGMPAFCRVVASVKDAPDSDIRIEMWLPKDGWTGVFHGNGNGGFGGIFDLGFAGMEAAVKRGYASANTDMGTAPSNPLDGDALIGHPQKWKDWGALDACDDGRRQGRSPRPSMARRPSAPTTPAARRAASRA